MPVMRLMTTANFARAWLAAMGTFTCLGLANAEEPPAPRSFEGDIQPFLATYCQRCHGESKQRGDRRFDTLTSDFDQLDTLEHWQDIVDQLNLGDMPPREAKQPSAEERRLVIDWITRELAAAHALRESSGGHTVARRLNRAQYDRTVRELLSLQDMQADPTESFPPDETDENFDNIAATLVMSDFLLEQYLSAASLVVSRAAAFGPKPELRKYHFTAPFCPTANRHDGLDEPGQYQHIRKNTSDEGGHLWLADLTEGVPRAGYYTFRFRAQAMFRDYPYDEAIVGTRKSEPLRAQIVVGDSNYGYLENRTSSDRALEQFEIADDEPRWYETRLWLDEGYQPRLTFPNGPNRVKSLRLPLVRAYPEKFPKFRVFLDADAESERIWAEYQASLKAGRKVALPTRSEVSKQLTTDGTGRVQNSRDGWSTFFREYEGPRIRVFEVELVGPIYDQWPPQSHVAMFGEHAATMDNAEAIVRRFAERAFRRPPREDEIETLLDLVETRKELGKSDEDCLLTGLKAVLCSPGFLYLAEPEGPLGDHALASRLSYFLWSSMPDAELLDLAAEGRLSDPEVLIEQAKRMLADDRAQALTTNFTSRWLQLYKIGSMPPDSSRFKSYYIDGLEPAIKRETQLFFHHLLTENLPITKFLDADFTFVNSSLARLYGIEGVTGNQFQMVNLADKRRGGLLGQASILTASANGIDTSPVIRGIWVLENILGAPPAPPPPDVEPLEPDIRGATTIRDQLRKHRDVQTCAECHRKIDPLGFALENFDPIGGWRDNYPRGRGAGPAVDPSGETHDGQPFQDIVGLKAILLERREQFARCLTEKMLTYAIGRRLEPLDRPYVDGIVERLEERGGGLRDLVLSIVASDAFNTN